MVLFRYDFESGMNNWVQLTDDQIDYKLTSGQASSSQTGPLTDHTTQESRGRMYTFFVNMLCNVSTVYIWHFMCPVSEIL